MTPRSALAFCDSDAVAPVAALRRALDDIAAVVMTLDTGTYCARPLPHVSGSVGEHVRHALDHIATLASSGGAEILSYDHRDRGTSIERDTTDALRHVLRLKGTFDRIAERSLDEPICVRTRLSTDGTELVSWSSFGRELAFVLDHTVHHQALIAALLAVQGIGIADDRFGYSASTPKS